MNARERLPALAESLGAAPGGAPMRPKVERRAQMVAWHVHGLERRSVAHLSEAARLRTIAVYCQKSPPLPGVHAWSLRMAERYLRDHPELLGTAITRTTIHRILREHALRPHRNQYYLQITDPDFFPRMEPLLKLYRRRPENLFCFDECTCEQTTTSPKPARTRTQKSSSGR